MILFNLRFMIKWESVLRRVRRLTLSSGRLVRGLLGILTRLRIILILWGIFMVVMRITLLDGRVSLLGLLKLRLYPRRYANRLVVWVRRRRFCVELFIWLASV